MPKMIDLTGMRFGRLVVSKMAHRSTIYILWECICDCGNTSIVGGQNLRRGATKSCGCFQRDARSENHRTHGMTHTRTYRTFHSMQYRCHNPNDNNYPDYGGRGIKVCERWTGKGGFENFLADMGERPEGLMLERMNNNGNYEPENCKWASLQEQANNRRNSRKITWNGTTQNLTSWARSVGKSSAWLIKRLKRMPLDKAMRPFDTVIPKE